MSIETKLVVGTLYVLLAPVLAGLLLVLLNKLTARMEGRQGAPLLQPLYDLMKLFQKRWPEEPERRKEGLSAKGAVCALAAGGVILASGGGLTSCALLFCAAELLLKRRVLAAAGGAALFGVAAGMFAAFGGDQVWPFLETGDAAGKTMIDQMPAGFAVTAALLVMALVGGRTRNAAACQDAGIALAWHKLAQAYGLMFLLTVLYVFLRGGVVENSWVAAILCVVLFFAAALSAGVFGRPGREKLRTVIGSLLLAALAFNLMVLSFQGV